jgi:hypothetical protein
MKRKRRNWQVLNSKEFLTQETDQNNAKKLETKSCNHVANIVSIDESVLSASSSKT